MCEARNVIKRFRLLFIIFILMFMVTGCAENEVVKATEKTRQVTVVTVKNEMFRETLVYTGFVSASQIIPVSFSIDGKVDTFTVNEGQLVETGDVLAELVKTGADSDALSQLYSPIDGVVASVIQKEGDLIGAGYPVIILRSDVQIMDIGVTDIDLKRIESFSSPSVTVDLGGKLVDAKVDSLSKLPDESSRLYNVTLILDTEEALLLGQMGTARIELLLVRGIWLPISYIQNDGEDYVYIVNSENRVERRNLELEELNNALIRVQGLKDGDRVITVGNSFVKEGQKVVVREATNE